MDARKNWHKKDRLGNLSLTDRMDAHRGKPTLARHIMGIIDWRCSNTIIDFDPKKYLKDEAERLKSQPKS